MHDENNPRSLPYDKVLSIFEDSHRQIWLTTQGGGFCKFHPETETFTSYDSRNGLPNDVVYQIVEDKEGLMWLTTNNGLVSFQPATGAMKVYTTANGLLGEQLTIVPALRRKMERFIWAVLTALSLLIRKTSLKISLFHPL